jgi:hypothetical protein
MPMSVRVSDRWLRPDGHARQAGGVIPLAARPVARAARFYPNAPMRISAADNVKIGAHSRYMTK